MSEIIFQVDPEFPFERLSLANPHGIQGGAFFSRILVDNEHPFFLQTPKCVTKNGIVVTDKKTYCDLMFTDDNEPLLQFLQDLEKHIQHLIYEKRDIWFGNPMNMENIEYFFNPILRTFKKNYLVRTYVQQPKHIKSLKSLQIYDENETRLELKDVNKDRQIITILEGLGIKFTSSSFHLELCLRQMMVLEDKPLFQKCLIQMKNSFINTSKKKPVMDEIKRENTLDEQDNLTKKKDTPDEQENLTKKEDTSAEEENLTKKEDTPDEQENLTKKEDTPDEQENLTKKEDTPDEQEKDKSEIVQDNKEENKIIKQKDMEKDKTKEQEMNKVVKTLEKELNEVNVGLNEVNVGLPDEASIVNLKEPLVVYKELYEKAKQKAKEMKRAAIAAFLEAKKIKKTFLLGEIEDSDDDDSEFSEIAE